MIGIKYIVYPKEILSEIIIISYNFIIAKLFPLIFLFSGLVKDYKDILRS